MVTSLSADAPVEYKNGFRNPRGDLPAVISRSFSSAMTLAKIGLVLGRPHYVEEAKRQFLLQ